MSDHRKTALEVRAENAQICFPLSHNGTTNRTTDKNGRPLSMRQLTQALNAHSEALCRRAEMSQANASLSYDARRKLSNELHAAMAFASTLAREVRFWKFSAVAVFILWIVVDSLRAVR
jgi:hypothetical protein